MDLLLERAVHKLISVYQVLWLRSQSQEGCLGFFILVYEIVQGVDAFRECIQGLGVDILGGGFEA